jgi:hypothetical protein
MAQRAASASIVLIFASRQALGPQRFRRLPVTSIQSSLAANAADCSGVSGVELQALKISKAAVGKTNAASFIVGNQSKIYCVTAKVLSIRNIA